MKKAIARHQEGISLNDYEYILDEHNQVMYFDTDDDAINYLNTNTKNNFSKIEWEEHGIFLIEINEQ